MNYGNSLRGVPFGEKMFSIASRLGCTGPYGDSARILARARAVYQFIAEITVDMCESRVTAKLEQISADEQAAITLLRDPVMRRAFDRVRESMAGSESVDWGAFASEIQVSSQPSEGIESQLATDVGFHLLKDTAETSPWVSAFHEVAREGLTLPESEENYRFLSARRGDYDSAEQACSFLHRYAPDLWQSARLHVAYLAVTEHSEPGFVAGSTRLVPATIFIARPTLTADVLISAEAILHEAVHNKLYDLQVTHALFKPQDEIGDDLVRPEWHQGRVAWKFNHAFAAFHVYAHLAAFYMGLLFRRQHGGGEELRELAHADTLIESTERCVDRARLLQRDLAPLCEGYAGSSGKSMFTWLSGVLNDLHELRRAA
ncbi:aKG-HExxH-type peptide beta-hydroxylase [Streptomyces sp. NPDC085614]|uniref:aKG-HExxH-type peptide beta-hydroxylase n=1 Tax=Streptomyces sp. NPDC085614 TaxID=3365733 RepID=UPI0037CF1CA8